MLFPKANPIRDPIWLKTVTERPCVITGGAVPVRRAAYINWRGGAGIGMNPSDDRVLPLAGYLDTRLRGMDEIEFWRETLPQNPSFKRQCWAALQRQGNTPAASPDELMMHSLIAWAEEQYRTWKTGIVIIPDKALSIMQPWGWCVIRPDIEDDVERQIAYARNRIKDVENRNWAFNNPAIKFRGPVLIHVGKKIDIDFPYNMAAAMCEAQIPAHEDLQRGGIIGMAEITDCVMHHDSPWFFGPRGLVLQNARPLPFMPCKGQLGFFNVTYDRSLLS